MKILTLNTWGGRVGDPLLDFFNTHQEIDVFLLQEVFQDATKKTRWDDRQRPNLFQEISDALPGHTGFFAPSVVNEWGLAAFVQKTVVIDEIGDFFVHKTMDSLIEYDGASIGRNVQYLKIRSEDNQPLAVLNFHGIWTGTGKNDTEDRLEQSTNIIKFIKTLNENVILCGDFNLVPDTESLRMITRELALKNLIKEFNISSTRTSLYPKPEKFADYIFISPEILIKKFQVLSDEVSDHAPILLEI